jgi:uncharacterized protein (TIGR02145 family)
MNLFLRISAIGLVIFAFVLQSCKKDEVPLVTTTEVTEITGNSAVCGGTITDNGSGPVIQRGICWSKNINPTIADDKRLDEGGTGSFTFRMSNLESTTLYYVRAYAINEGGTGYGNEISFKTGPAGINFSDWISYGSMTDQDGNIYRSVQIGDQTWMAENLRTEHFQDGSPIPHITDRDTWYLSVTGAFCYYNNETQNKNIYGALYNWYAVTDTHRLCPSGWHVPSDEEWTILENFLGGSQTAGMKIKEVGLYHWISPNLGATNLTGFTALPAGSRCFYANDNFLGLEYYCMWWSSTPHHTFDQSAWYRTLITFESSLVRNYYLKRVGFSVRCLKD